MPTIEVSNTDIQRLQTIAGCLNAARQSAENALLDLARKRGADVGSAKVKQEIEHILAKFGGNPTSPQENLRSLLDYCEPRLALVQSSSALNENVHGGTMREFKADTPPDLRHTRVLRARFGNQTAAGWNAIVHAAHIEACANLGSAHAVKKITKSNLIVGKASSEEKKRGYRYVADIDASIQNVSAEQAWLNALDLAKRLKEEVVVEFEWMDKADSAYPGKTGRLHWK
jgi:hypothetical protein